MPFKQRHPLRVATATLLMGISCAPVLVAEASTKGAVQVDASGSIATMMPPALEDGVQRLAQENEELVAHSKAADARAQLMKEKARQAQVEVHALHKELLEAQIQIEAATGFAKDALAHVEEADEATLAVLARKFPDPQLPPQHKPEGAKSTLTTPTLLLQMDAELGQAQASESERASTDTQLEAFAEHQASQEHRRAELQDGIDEARAIARTLAAEIVVPGEHNTPQAVHSEEKHVRDMASDVQAMQLSLLQVGSTRHDIHERPRRHGEHRRASPASHAAHFDESVQVPASLGDDHVLGDSSTSGSNPAEQLHAEGSVFQTLSSKVASLEQQISETELQNRQAYDAHKVVYEEELRKKRTANADQKAKNEAAAHELEEAIQHNSELRKKAEGLRSDIHAWEHDLAALKENISSALEFTSVVFEQAQQAHASEELQILQDLAEADAKHSEVQTQRERLNMVAIAGHSSSLLQTGTSAQDVPPGFLKTLDMELDTLSVEHTRREQQLKLHYAKLLAVEGQKREALLNESAALATARARVEETGRRLDKAISFLDSTVKKLETNARSVRLYAQRLGLRPPPTVHRPILSSSSNGSSSSSSSSTSSSISSTELAAEAGEKSPLFDFREGDDDVDAVAVLERQQDHGSERPAHADPATLGLFNQAALKGVPGATFDDRAAESMGIAAPGVEASETTHAIARAAATVAKHAATGAHEAIKQWPNWWSMLSR